MLRDKDEDDGPPSETEEDRRQQESRAKEIRGDHCRKKKLHSVLLCCTGLTFNTSHSRAPEKKGRTDHLITGGEGGDFQRACQLQCGCRGSEHVCSGAHVIQGHS